LTKRINLGNIVLGNGISLAELSQDSPVMLVFLRHLGCVFCKESLQELSAKKDYFIDRNVKLVFVHMGAPDRAVEFFDNYDLGDFDTISDPECTLYEQFGLIKGTFNQLFGLQVMLRGLEASIVKGNSFSLKQIGDGFQMPGIFYLLNGEIVQSFIHKRASDRPDYEEMVNCCTS